MLNQNLPLSILLSPYYQDTLAVKFRLLVEFD